MPIPFSISNASAGAILIADAYDIKTQISVAVLRPSSCTTLDPPLITCQPNLLFTKETRRRARPEQRQKGAHMGYILYKDKIEEPAQQVIVSVESPHVVRIAAMGDAEAPEINTSGFKLYLDSDCKYPLDQGEYEAYTTLYRKGDNWHELSDDGSVYTEPVAPVQPELTEEEKAELDRQTQIQQVTAQIADLKARIAASDYKVIKTYEYTLLGEQTEYDMEAVHAERQALRDQINTLETQLADLTAE